MKYKLKRPFNRLLAVLPIGLFVVIVSFDVNAGDDTEARKVAQAVSDRDSGDKQMAKATMTLVDASGRKRERVLQIRAMDFDKGTKTLIMFESPADVRDTGLLSIDYDGDRDDDQWLYLPSLHKTTRIASSGKSGSFVGTDLSYADMTSKNVDAYEYTMVKDSVKVDGEECWLIESRPKTDKEKKETGYLKTQSWISKDKLLPLQAKIWVEEGKKLKYMKFEDIKKVNGIWTVHKLLVRTVKNGKVESTTVMQFTSIKFDEPSVTDSDFSERRLEQGI